MKNLTLILISGLVLTSCVTPRSQTNALEMGMSQEEVMQIMGEPESSSLREDGTQCLNYSLWRDFWNRSPGNYSDRYYACFRENMLVSYGNQEDR